MNPISPSRTEAAWGRIIPFLGPIELLIRGPEISDIMVNWDRAVFFEKHAQFDGVAIHEKSLQVCGEKRWPRARAETSEGSPILDSRLLDGSRVVIVLLSICRWHRRRDSEVPESALRRCGTRAHRNIDVRASGTLEAAFRNRNNIMMSSATGGGKKQSS